MRHRRINWLTPKANGVSWTRNRAGIMTGSGGPLSTWSDVAAGGSNQLGSASTLQLQANPSRACLIIQNNSPAGGANLYYDFGKQAVAGQCFILVPGAGLVIAEAKSCPKEAIYTAWSAAGGIGKIYENSLPETQSPVSSEQVAASAWGLAVPSSAPAPSSGGVRLAA